MKIFPAVFIVFFVSYVLPNMFAIINGSQAVTVTIPEDVMKLNPRAEVTQINGDEVRKTVWPKNGVIVLDEPSLRGLASHSWRVRIKDEKGLQQGKTLVIYKDGRGNINASYSYYE